MSEPMDDLKPVLAETSKRLAEAIKNPTPIDVTTLIQNTFKDVYKNRVCGDAAEFIAHASLCIENLIGLYKAVPYMELHLHQAGFTVDLEDLKLTLENLKSLRTQLRSSRIFAQEDIPYVQALVYENNSGRRVKWDQSQLDAYYMDLLQKVAQVANQADSK